MDRARNQKGKISLTYKNSLDARTGFTNYYLTNKQKPKLKASDQTTYISEGGVKTATSDCLFVVARRCAWLW